MPVTLPAELWIRILSLISNDTNNRPKLWVSGRAVCTAFKNAIETIFRENHLSKTFISYHLGTHYLDYDSTDEHEERFLNKVVLTPKFVFSHLSADKSTAFFVDPDVHAKFKPLIISNLRFALEMVQFENPPHTVQVRRALNDTPIPGLSIDYDAMTLSCDWRGLYSAFFAEELLVDRIRDREMAAFDARRAALIGDIRSGRVDMVAAMQEMLAKYGNASDDARKQARRVRIRRQYEREGYRDWKPMEGDEEEKDRVNRVLKEGRFFASAQDFSDEEGRDGDEEDYEEDDVESDEEDEWEDEDEEGGDEENGEKDDEHFHE